MHDLSHQELYRQTVRDLPLSEKLHLARGAVGDLLKVLCHDQNAEVIIALLENPEFGLTHARIVAKHHHTAAGLEILTRKPTLVADSEIKTDLHRNHASTELVLTRSFHSLNLIRLHNIAGGHEAAEHAKLLARDALRAKFDQSSPDQQAQFIITTEGRCLRFFYQTQFKTETVEFLSKHCYLSFILVHNLLIFPGLPPAIVRAIFRSPVIWRNLEFRRRILGHTNCPTDVKIKGKT
ncbi:TPA: hypothetical protein DF272_04165 [Candidatus Falkowbacteria bacterium]|nr:hypothetical protein [Candidatus Falkowbacteria bacterium]